MTDDIPELEPIRSRAPRGVHHGGAHAIPLGDAGPLPETQVLSEFAPFYLVTDDCDTRVLRDLVTSGPSESKPCSLATGPTWHSDGYDKRTAFPVILFGFHYQS